jgi:hypothetical protein
MTTPKSEAQAREYLKQVLEVWKVKANLPLAFNRRLDMLYEMHKCMQKLSDVSLVHEELTVPDMQEIHAICLNLMANVLLFDQEMTKSG